MAISSISSVTPPYPPKPVQPVQAATPPQPPKKTDNAANDTTVGGATNPPRQPTPAPTAPGTGRLIDFSA